MQGNSSLFMLLGARKKQALLTIDIANVIVQTDKAILLLIKTLKYTNTKHTLEPLVCHSFSENENLFIVICLEVYRGERNKRMVGNQGQLMNYIQKARGRSRINFRGLQNFTKKN